MTQCRGGRAGLGPCGSAIAAASGAGTRYSQVSALAGCSELALTTFSVSPELISMNVPHPPHQTNEASKSKLEAQKNSPWSPAAPTVRCY